MSTDAPDLAPTATPVERPLRSPWGAVGGALVALVALAYAPLAMEYMAHAFVAGAPQWQDEALGVVVGRDFATGTGSVEYYRAADYTHQRWAMLVHTGAGGLALVLTVLQFSARLRRARPGLHRRTGRVALVLVAVSMAAATLFLLRAPVVEHYNGAGFDAQLWLLAAGTLTAAACALAAIRLGRVAAHQAWAAMLLAMLMTAPLLRVSWMVLGVAWPGADLLTTLGAGSIALAVWAPAGAIVAARRLTVAATRRPVAWTPPPVALPVLAVLAVLASASTVAWATSLATPWGFRVVVTLPVAVALTAVAFAVADVRTARRGEEVVAGRWRLHLAAVLVVPVLVEVLRLALAPTGLAGGELATFVLLAMTVPALPLFATFALDAATTGPRSPRRAAS